MTGPSRVQESSDETDLFIGEISPPMLPETLFRTDQGDRRVAGLSFLHVKISFCADGGKDFGML